MRTACLVLCSLTLLAVQSPVAGARSSPPPVSDITTPQVTPRPIPRFVEDAVAWLVSVQHEDGGWGAGFHDRQEITDPSLVPSDPAATAFTAMTLLRCGNTPTSGAYANTVRRATEYLITQVANAPTEGPLITDMTGTQIQSKLGKLIDTSMTVLFFSRLLPQLPEGDLRDRADAALGKCLRKLEGAQEANGGWGHAGWAGVLQSSIGYSALEMASAAGKRVDSGVLDRAREHHLENYDRDTGKASAADGAGVELYAWSTSLRAAAGEARQAENLVNQAKREGRIEADAPVSEQVLDQLGLRPGRAKELMNAYSQVQQQNERLSDQQLIDGFGNNGGEEFLSYLLTSESLVITGGRAWDEWNERMHRRLAAIQAENATWGGQHCITTPVFCTSAVVQCLTADRDADLLAAAAGVDREGDGE